MSNWIWVTRPDYYLEPDGSDRVLGGLVDGAWWTCSKEVRRGDHVLLYRTSPRKDIKYLLVTESDAKILPPGSGEFSGDFACNYRGLQTFADPLTIAEMRSDRLLANSFSALKGRFQGRSFSVDPLVWERLVDLLSSKNPAPLLPDQVHVNDVALEYEMEEIVKNRLDRFGISGLRLESDAAGDDIGQQRFTDVGFIDLLCRDGRGGWVVVEIKRHRVDRRALGQLLSYMGWVAEQVATKSQKVKGRLVGRGLDKGLREALSLVPEVEFVDYSHFA